MKNICVVIDDREKTERIDDALKFFNEQGFRSKKERLPVGDYLFDKKLVFEWKTPEDFIGSVMNKRVFKQAQRMRQYPFSYIIIVGNPYEYLVEQYKIQKYMRSKRTLKEFTINNLLGAIASLVEHDNVVIVENNNQAFTIMSYLAKNILTKDNHAPIEKPVCKMTDAVGTFLCCIDTISTKKAILIKEHLHLENLKDLLEITKEDLTNINGIGSKTADKIIGEIG